MIRIRIRIIIIIRIRVRIRIRIRIRPIKFFDLDCLVQDHHTSTGVVHVVDKVMQPATKTLGKK